MIKKLFAVYRNREYIYPLPLKGEEKIKSRTTDNIKTSTSRIKPTIDKKY